jgi:N-acyl-D-aspartate/D-glutamate deacylase
VGASAQLLGLGALAVGLALLVATTVIRDPVLAVLAMLGSGVGHGFIFVGDMSEITMAAPAEERGAVIGSADKGKRLQNYRRSRYQHRVLGARQTCASPRSPNWTG